MVFTKFVSGVNTQFSTELNQNFSASAWTRLHTTTGSFESLSGVVVGHSTDTLSYYASGGTIYQTTNNGETRTSRLAGIFGSAIAANVLGGNCKANRGRAIFFVRSATTHDVAYTTDSGATWTSGTAIGIDSAGTINAFSYPTASLAVIAGDDGAGTDNVWFSTNGGSTWTAATTQPGSTGSIIAMDMFDANNGMAIDSSGNIWVTSDGAVNWSDSGNNVASLGDSSGATVGVTARLKMYSTTDAIYLIIIDAATTISRINSSTGEIASPNSINIPWGGVGISDPIITANGNVAFYTYCSFTTTDVGPTFAYVWNPSSTLSRIWAREIPTAVFAASTSDIRATRRIMTEAGDGELYINADYSTVEIDDVTLDT